MRKPTEEEIRNDFIVFADDTVPIGEFQNQRF